MEKLRTSWWRESDTHGFGHVHLPDDGQELLTPPVRTLRSELVDSAGRNELALVRFRRGDQLSAGNRFPEAADEYQKCFEASPSLSAQLARGVAYMMISDLEGAAEAFEVALSVRSGQRCLKVASMVNLGQAYGDLGRPRCTIRMLEKAIEVSDVAGMSCLSVLSRSRLAFMLHQHGRPDESMARCDEAARLYGGTDEYSGLSNVFCVRGLVLSQFGEIAQAERAFRDGMAQSKSLRRSYSATRACMHLAHLHALQGKGADATKLVAAVSRLPDTRRRARCQGILALTYLKDGKTQEALAALQVAARLDRETGYLRGMARDALISGQICFQHGLVPEALHALSEASRIAAQIGHAALGIETSALYAVTRTDISASEKASALVACISRCRAVRRPRIEVRLQSVLAHMWMEAGELAQAQSAGEVALEQSKTLGSPLDEANCCATLGRLRELEGRPEQALELGSRGQAILQTLGMA